MLDEEVTVNPNNPNDNYCSAYAATTAIYLEELGSRLDRISSKLIEYTSKFDWNSIKFPAVGLIIKDLKDKTTKSH